MTSLFTSGWNASTPSASAGLMPLLSTTALYPASILKTMEMPRTACLWPNACEGGGFALDGIRVKRPSIFEGTSMSMSSFITGNSDTDVAARDVSAVQKWNYGRYAYFIRIIIYCCLPDNCHSKYKEKTKLSSMVETRFRGTLLGRCHPEPRHCEVRWPVPF